MDALPASLVYMSRKDEDRVQEEGEIIALPLRAARQPDARLIHPSASRLLTIEQASSYSGLSVRTLRDLRAHRAIPVVKIGRRVFFRRDHLDAFIENCTQDALRSPRWRS